MLAAVASAQANDERCRQDEATFAAQLASQMAAPRIWWEMPKGGVAAKVPGFTDQSADEGARAFLVAPQKGDPGGSRGLALASLPCDGAYTRDD